MDSTKKKYESFEVVDLVLNDDFKRLVSEKGNVCLSGFIENSEGYEQNIRIASKIVLGLVQKKESQSLDLKYRLWRQIQNNRRRQKNFAIFRYAAVLILCLSLGGGVFYWVKQPLRIIELAESTPMEYGQFKLILPDGKTVFLTGSNPTVKSTDKGKTLLVNDSIQINQSSEGFNQIIVPYGHRGTVLLADGTQVSLNSGSRLVYPPQFAESKREVYLEGEGFFRVKKNEDKPFCVQTNRFEVRVLGTTFNVQAYENENLYNTVLVEGKVNLKLNRGLLSKSVGLLPNQVASLTENRDQVRVESVSNTSNYTSWVNGYLEFKNGDLESLLKRISMHYNIRINLIGGINQLTINGKLDLTDNPETIIAGVAEIAKMKYKKKGEHNYILYK